MIAITKTAAILDAIIAIGTPPPLLSPLVLPPGFGPCFYNWS